MPTSQAFPEKWKECLESIVSKLVKSVLKQQILEVHMATLTKGILVTIIGEAVLQERLIHLFTQLNVSGYTLIPAKGAGSHGKRMGDVAGYNTNIEIKTIVNSTTSDQLLEAVRPFQAKHALIAFRQEVEGLFD